MILVFVKPICLCLPLNEFFPPPPSLQHLSCFWITLICHERRFKKKK